MPINVIEQDGRPRIQLEGVVAIEEVDQLLDLLRQVPLPEVDLSACQHLHTAAVQVLLTIRPTIAAPAPDSFWNRCLEPIIPTTLHEENC